MAKVGTALCDEDCLNCVYPDCVLEHVTDKAHREQKASELDDLSRLDPAQKKLCRGGDFTGARKVRRTKNT